MHSDLINVKIWERCIFYNQGHDKSHSDATQVDWNRNYFLTMGHQTFIYFLMENVCIHHETLKNRACYCFDFCICIAQQKAWHIVNPQYKFNNYGKNEWLHNGSTLQSLSKKALSSLLLSVSSAVNIPSYRWRSQGPEKQTKSCFSHGCSSLHFLKQACCLGMAAGSRDPGKPAACYRVKIRPSFPPWAPSVTPTAL